MMNVNIARLEKTIEEVQAVLKDSLVATNAWDRESGLPIAGYNEQPAATALFNRLTVEMQETLAQASFPEIGTYYTLDLEGDMTVVIVLGTADLWAGILLDTTKVNLGILVGVVIPTYLRGLREAAGVID